MLTQFISFISADKLDSSFSRSRSSSMSSLENISAEAIQCLAFADSYTKKAGKYLLRPSMNAKIFSLFCVLISVSCASFFDSFVFLSHFLTSLFLMLQIHARIRHSG